MIHFYKSFEGKLMEVPAYEAGAWINVFAPTEEEIARLVNEFELEADHIAAALDEEEMPRIEKEDKDTLIIFDTPMMQQQDHNITYFTMPVGIISTEKNVITISSVKNPLFEDFIENRIRDINTDFKTKFILQIMLKISTRFLQHLKQIDKISMYIERQLRKSMKNQELIQLLELDKSLVYFNTSLKSDELAIKKVMSGRFIKLYEEDHELIEDVLIEINQAQEMANIYLNILSGTMNAFASVISNNLNAVMKILASITIVISIPTIIASFYGMNVGNSIPVPSFWFPVGISLLLMGLTTYVLYKKKLF